MKSPIIAAVILILIIGGLWFLISRTGAPGEPGASNMEMVTDPDDTFIVSTNPEGADNDSLLLVLMEEFTSLPFVTGLADQGSVESVAMEDGTIFVTVDGTTEATGGVLVFASTTDVAARSFSTASGMIMGATTALNAPRGIEVSDDLSMIIVSDFGAKNIKLFPIDATGDVAPAYTVGLGAGEGSVWDTTYHDSSDTLFAAGTSGTVLVYDDFSVNFGAAGPTRIITPSLGGQKISVNIHGIQYNSSRDALVLSDVGSATDAADGQVMILADIGSTSGNVNVVARIRGDQTKLGNPVDLLLDGSTLLVAEKSNDLVLEYDEIFDAEGELNLAPTRTTAVTKPESLSSWRD